MPTYSYIAPNGENTQFQTYTITVTGTYDLSAFGGGGGAATSVGAAGGSGAEIGGTFNLSAGQQLQIIVGGGGGAATSGGGGGGGFSEILVNSGPNGTYVPLLIAGGGGGGGIGSFGFGSTGDDAPAYVAGLGLGGGGSGGAANFRGAGGGGAGATGDGGTTPNGPGPVPSNGSGGFTAPSYAGGAAGSGTSGGGGFGGGGGGGGVSGGGGAGSTGGAGGDGTNFPFGGSSGGFAGTSYLAGTATLNGAETRSGAGISTGNGSARITFIPAAPAPAPAPAAPCYVTGTRIRVLRGRTIADAPVDRLRVGDLAITASGKPRPIRWIGSRSYPGLSAPRHDRPVRIRAGALQDGVPARDLLVSPDHCLFLDGLFVAAGHLVNGHTITRGEAVAELTYWHVELDSHDLLLAENTPAESFLAAPGVRGQFDGTNAFDAAQAPVAYAPRAEPRSPEVMALCDRLVVRAGLSIEPVRFGAVRAWMDVCDGRRVAGWAQDAEHPDAPVCLDIAVDGAVVAMALAQDHRADLAAAGMGDGRHGFDLDLDEPLAAGVAHTVEVRRSADGAVICAKAVDVAGVWTALLAA